MKKIMMMACALAVAGVAVAVENSWQKTWCEEIDLTDITSVPIGMKLVEASGFSLPTNGGEMAQCNVPHEWSEGGSCGALRVSGVLVDCGSRQILGAIGSHIYPTVAEGAFAITNGLQKAVLSASHRIGMFYPLQIEKDGSGTIRYEWNANGKTLELFVKCYVNERRQMAVCTLLHVKGDGLRAGLGDGLQNQPNKKGTTK